MTDSTKRLIIVLFTAGSLLLAGGAQAKAPHPQISESETIIPLHRISPHEAQIMSNDAVAVLRHVAIARGYLHQKKYDFAKDELSQAGAVLDVIRSDVPTARIKDRISIAENHLQYDTVEKVQADLVPIYSDLKYVANLVPTREAQNHLDRAKASLKKGDKQTAANELRAANAAIAYTEVDLPLSETQSHVRAAMHAINDHQFKSADQDLASVERDLQTNFAELAAAPEATQGPSTSVRPPERAPSSDPSPKPSAKSEAGVSGHAAHGKRKPIGPGLYVNPHEHPKTYDNAKDHAGTTGYPNGSFSSSR